MSKSKLKQTTEELFKNIEIAETRRRRKIRSIQREVSSFIGRVTKNAERVHLTQLRCKQVGSNAYKYNARYPKNVRRSGKLFIIKLEVGSKDLVKEINKKRLVVYKRSNSKKDLILAWKYNGDKFAIFFRGFFNSNHPPVHVAVKSGKKLDYLGTFNGTNGWGPDAPLGKEPKNIVSNKYTYVGSEEHFQQFLPEYDTAIPTRI